MEITNIGLCDYNAYSFLLTLYLKQREGFLNKMLYEISFTVIKITKESKLENYSNLKTITNNNDPSSSFIYGYQIRDNLKTTTLRKSVPKCIYCDLVMTVKQEYKPHPVEYKPKINIVTDRFFTSEYIKISNNQTYIKDIHTTNECSTLFNIKSNQKHIYKFRIINCPSVKHLNFSGAVLRVLFLAEIMVILLYITRQKRRNYLNPLLFYHYTNRTHPLILTKIHHHVFQTKKKFGFYEEILWVAEIKHAYYS